MSSGGHFANILEELWGFRGEVQTSSDNNGFSEECCCVMDNVHERARLTAVVQCSGVCEATALAKKWWPVVPTAERCGQERGQLSRLVVLRARLCVTC